jgi:hypothetical protein
MSYRENDHEYESHEIDDDHSESDDLNEWDESQLEYSSRDAYDDRDDFITGGFEEAQEHLGSVAYQSEEATETAEHADSHLENEIDELHTDGVELADTDGDGLLERISETWMPANATVAQTLRYVSTDGDDNIAVRSSVDAVGGTGADSFVVREASHLRIDDFDDTQGDHLVFDTGLGLTRVDLEHYVTGIEATGADLVVHFGPDVSITLVGVAASTTLGWDDVTVLS